MLSIFNITYVLTFQTQHVPSLALTDHNSPAARQARRKSAARQARRKSAAAAAVASASDQ